MTFFCKRNDYMNIIQLKDGEFDLFNDIDFSQYGKENFHKRLLLRHQNDFVNIVDTEVLYKWFEMGNTTSPFTREDISYLKERVNFKYKCLKELSETSSDLTNDFLLKIWGKFLHAKGNPDEKTLLQIRSYIDPSFLEKNKLLTLGFQNDVPVGKWYLRKSSKHNNVFLDSEVFTVCCQKEGGHTTNYRLFHIKNVGWTWKFDETCKTYKEFIEKGYCINANLKQSFIDLIHEDWSNFHSQ